MIKSRLKLRVLSLALGGVMRKLFVGVTALAWCCAAVSAHAADQRAVPLKAPPVPIATWSGFYLGLDAGFQSTRTDLTLISIATVGGVLGPQTIPPGGATTLPYDGTGARLGAFGGYNWQASPQWVFGAEADFGWTDKKTTLNGVAIPAFFCCANIGHSSYVQTNWDASVRGRAGFLVTPTFMVYLTGGVAWQRFETNSSCGPPFCAPVPPPGVTFVPFSITNAFTKTGYTVGGGIETMLWPNWFLRASYRYAEFGTVSFDVTNAVTGGVAAGTTLITSTMDLKLRTHTASFGVAYKFGESAATAYAADRSAMPVKGPIYKAPPAPPVSWTGFYLGLDVGLRSTHTDVITTSALENGVPRDFTNFATEEPLNKTSIRFGSYAGYNWHAAPLWVVGIEVDAGWAERDATLPGFRLQHQRHRHRRAFGQDHLGRQRPRPDRLSPQPHRARLCDRRRGVAALRCHLGLSRPLRAADIRARTVHHQQFRHQNGLDSRRRLRGAAVEPMVRPRRISLRRFRHRILHDGADRHARPDHLGGR